MRSAFYYAYMHSAAWYAKRKRALLRAQYRCQKCRSPKRLDVHHLTYERLGHEWDTDLVVLCRKCHDQVHGKTTRRVWLRIDARDVALVVIGLALTLITLRILLRF